MSTQCVHPVEQRMCSQPSKNSSRPCDGKALLWNRAGGVPTGAQGLTVAATRQSGVVTPPSLQWRVCSSRVVVRTRRPRSLRHRAQTCTFEFPGHPKHQNSTRRHPKRDKQSENVGGRGKKKERHFGRSGGGRWRGSKPTTTHTQHQPTTTQQKLAKIGLAKIGLAKVGHNRFLIIFRINTIIIIIKIVITRLGQSRNGRS